MNNDILQGDVITRLRDLLPESVHTCITSPPYWGLRDYGLPPSDWPAVTFTPAAGLPELTIPAMSCCLGLEPGPWAFVGHMVMVFREVGRVLRGDGTVWCNLGDSYAGSINGRSAADTKAIGNDDRTFRNKPFGTAVGGLKPKDLCGLPWMVAKALQADGWWLRSDIIWAKPNPMPESVTDRPTKAHEYLFLLAKSERYFYDNEAVREAAIVGYNGSMFTNGKTAKARQFLAPVGQRERQNTEAGAGRNRRTVWSIATQPFSGAKLLADYVGPDGKPYKVSPDCPVHGRRSHSQKTYKDEYDGQSDHSLSRNPGSNDHHDAEHPDVSAATISHKNLVSGGENSDGHNPENIAGNKISSSHHEHKSDEQKSDHTEDNHIQCEYQDRKKNYSGQSYSEIASDHNTQTSKTDPDHQTSQRDTAFSQIDDHRQNNGQLPLLFGKDHDSDENNISEAETDDNPSNQILDGTVGKQQQRVFSVAQVTSQKRDNQLYCTCEIVSTDHFATFPPALVEPCILAGTSARGVCPACGAAWERMVEIAGYDRQRWAPGEDQYHTQAKGKHGKTSSFTTGDVAIKNTTGWRPTCTCDAAAPVPATVLDPFFGSGTTGAVAVECGRQYIGIELNPEYVELAQKRLAGAQPALIPKGLE